MPSRHPLEDEASWLAHLSRQQSSSSPPLSDRHRSLRRHHHSHDDDGDEIDPMKLEKLARIADIRQAEQAQKNAEKQIAKEAKKRRKRYAELYRSSGIGERSVHGLMIDAGSTGSRMHIYQFEPRTLANRNEVEAAVRGEKLSFPGIESRWTERLRPGIATFGDLEGEALTQAIAEYLQPLISFATSVLHTKREQFDSFPIFLKATAGMRTLSIEKRQRIISTVRTLFANSTYCPFWDQKERVRVISGEEEAVYGWAGVNFLLGNLMQNSEGAGEAGGGAIQTYGALDMGGASTQISFYQPEGDVMSGLFKLQIGQGKHWNVYAHSHLMFGHVMAEERFKARLVIHADAKERLVDGVYNPCLPGGGKKKMEFKSNIHFDAQGMETRNANVDDIPSIDEDGSYHAVLVNNEPTGDWEQCKLYAREILNESSNAWCQFSHQGSCSFAGVYQPELPTQDEFFAFSNYFHVWQFLQLPPRSSIAELDAKGKQVCSQSWDAVVDFNKKNKDKPPTEDELASYCFQSAYVHSVLRHGYGFKDHDFITATDIINGQKVTWALGSILYEINTLPWDYIEVHGQHHVDQRIRENMFDDWHKAFGWFMASVIVCCALILVRVLRFHQKNKTKGGEGYEALKDVDNFEIEKLPPRKK
eukprot:CCRYP_015889-RA/>CCRYP_015889-RA protein AED:0.01 eAED:0.01 QI:377/1/1/1/1/1/2/995/645